MRDYREYINSLKEVCPAVDYDLMYATLQNRVCDAPRKKLKFAFAGALAVVTLRWLLAVGPFSVKFGDEGSLTAYLSEEQILADNLIMEYVFWN